MTQREEWKKILEELILSLCNEQTRCDLETCEGECKKKMDLALEKLEKTMMSRAEIEKIIKESELWRMSNYVGRDTGEYSEDGLNGTQILAKAIVKKMRE